METEITAEQFYERLAKLQEERTPPKITPDHPLMICCNKNCNARYTLPMKYEDAHPMFRDYCPSCVITIYDEEDRRRDVR